MWVLPLSAAQHGERIGRQKVSKVTETHQTNLTTILSPCLEQSGKIGGRAKRRGLVPILNYEFSRQARAVPNSFEQCRAEKNARSELGGFHRILHDKTALPTNNDSRDAACHVPTMSIMNSSCDLLLATCYLTTIFCALSPTFTM